MTQIVTCPPWCCGLHDAADTETATSHYSHHLGAPALSAHRPEQWAGGSVRPAMANVYVQRIGERPAQIVIDTEGAPGTLELSPTEARELAARLLEGVARAGL